jgi:hypothetical protein
VVVGVVEQNNPRQRCGKNVANQATRECLRLGARRSRTPSTCCSMPIPPVVGVTLVEVFVELVAPDCEPSRSGAR